MIVAGDHPREVHEAVDEGSIHVGSMWLGSIYLSQQGQFLLPFHDTFIFIN